MPVPTALPAPGATDVLYLIDLSGYVFRAYHAITPLSNAHGEPTHATYGTVNMLAKLVDERKPTYLAVAMDSPGRTFRDDLDARYKAHRPAPPSDLSIQMKRCRQIVDAYRIPVFVTPGIEADDLIAVATERAKAAGLRVVIASADKDLMQLVDDRVMLWDAMRDRVYGVSEVTAKFGVAPPQVRDLLALVGDSTDNVPGVPGIGMKTAAELLKQFGTLEAIYAGLAEVKKPRTREALKEHEQDARVSQQLVSLRRDVPLDMDLETVRYAGADTTALRAIFTELGFTRFLKFVPVRAEASEPYRALLGKDELAAFAALVRASGRLGIEVHATERDPMRAHICGIALADRPGHAVYVPLGHRYLGAPPQLAMSDFLDVIGPLLRDRAIAKVGHDVKFSEVVLLRHGVELAGVAFDTMLASYLLDPEDTHDLAEMAEREAGVKIAQVEALAPRRRGQPPRGFDDVEVEQAARRAAAFPDLAMLLEQRLSPRLKAEQLDGLLRDLELPLETVLARMEHVGVLVDPAALETIGQEMATQLAVLEEKGRSVAGQDFNLASPKQLETILFDELGLRATRRTKTGRSTDAEALEALVDDHPLPGIVLEHRVIAKLKGTYVDALPRLIHPETGRIHARWNQAVAATGRLSSQDPNLQNIPIRTALGKSIRRAFIAPPGSMILSADYSQIELRILAHLSKDPVLVDAFRTGQDVHVRTAMEIFGVDERGVTDEMRRRSKTINFGVIYGMGEVALAKRLGISRAQAAEFIEAYFVRYRGVHDFMERTMAEARRTEVVRTLLGRQRHLPDLRNSDAMRRSYAERIAQNTPIQGTAADLLKLAMVRLAEPVVPGVRMVLTVHDELVFEVPADRVHDAATAIRGVMESVFPLDVPLLVEVGGGPTWADAH